MSEENEQSEAERFLSRQSVTSVAFDYEFFRNRENARRHALPPVVRYETEYEISKPFKKMVATKYDRFKVLEYTEVEDVHVTPILWKFTTWYDEQGRLMGKKERVYEPRD